MSHVRPAVSAGLFYPANRADLCAVIERDLQAARNTGVVPKGLIVPHAGYDFSGPIAATAFAALRPLRNIIRRVILLGPAHRVPFRGLAATTAQAFATPLGTVPVDRTAIDDALRLPQVRLLEAAHRDEHSLEVQLPFLQILLAEFQVAPFLVGKATSENVCQLLELLWGGAETLIVVSSDLSHFHPYDEARKLDRAAAAAIERLDPDRLLPDQACGRTAVRGLLAAARKHGLKSHTLDLRNSGDTAGPRNEVVGYGAFAFEEPISLAEGSKP